MLVNEFEWWKGGPVVSSGILTREQLKAAWEKVKEQGEGAYWSPALYLSPAGHDYYLKLLAKMYWKEAYREFRMFRTACEKGWLNARL